VYWWLQEGKKGLSNAYIGAVSTASVCSAILAALIVVFVYMKNRQRLQRLLFRKLMPGSGLETTIVVTDIQVNLFN
jgi:hypothetical protein